MRRITCDDAINEIADTLAEADQDMIVSVYNIVMANKAKAVEDITSMWNQIDVEEDEDKFFDDERREELIDEHAQESIDNMDMGDLCEYAKDRMEDRLREMSDADLLAEIKNINEHILTEEELQEVTLKDRQENAEE